MTREEFIEKHELKYFGFPTQHESWKADIDELLKERAVAFMQHHYKIRGATLTDDFTNDLYDTFIN